MKMKLKAVCLDFATLGPDVDTSVLDQLVDVEYFPYTSSDEVAARLAEAQIAIVNKAKIDADAIAGAADLRLIVLTATGTDNVDTAAAMRHGVAVANIRGYCNDSVVQHVFALVLSLTQQIHRFDALAKSGSWQHSPTFALFDYPIRELSGLKLGIVGYGSLGQAVGRVGNCLGMQVLVSERPGGSRGDRMPFPTVLREADVLSLHCPLTEATRNLLSRDQFSAMKRDALLINTARGGLIDSGALVAALETGEIAGAGIDVLPEEPPVCGDPLLTATLPNLIVTPHVAWAAREARQRALNQVVENISEFMAGRQLRRVV